MRDYYRFHNPLHTAGLAAYTAKEISSALINFRENEKYVKSLVASLKNNLKTSKEKVGWLRKSKWEEATKEHHRGCFDTWAAYFWSKGLVSEDVKKVAEDIKGDTYYQLSNTLYELSDGGRKDCQLTPLQAFFVNKWRDKNVEALRKESEEKTS